MLYLKVLALHFMTVSAERNEETKEIRDADEKQWYQSADANS